MAVDSLYNNNAIASKQYLTIKGWADRYLVDGKPMNTRTIRSYLYELNPAKRYNGRIVVGTPLMFPIEDVDAYMNKRTIRANKISAVVTAEVTDV